MLSSPLFLSLASVFSLIGLFLVLLAGVTDNWTEVQVNRREIINAFKREPELSLRLQQAFGHNILYFSRNYGLFNLCFPDTVPQDVGSFNKVGSPCIWNTEFSVPESKKEHFSNNETYRHWAAKGVIIAYVIGIVSVVLSFIAGIIGCWNRAKKFIMFTGILLMLAGLFMSLAMLMWHYVAYSERYTLDMEPYYKSWEPVLKLTSRHNYGWSYIVSWIGIGFTVIASACMFFAYSAVKKEEEVALSAKHGAYLMPNYYDKGTGAIVPYNYNTYAGERNPNPELLYNNGAVPGYGSYPYYNQYNTAGYYGYMTYGR